VLGTILNLSNLVYMADWPGEFNPKLGHEKSQLYSREDHRGLNSKYDQTTGELAEEPEVVKPQITEIKIEPLPGDVSVTKPKKSFSFPEEATKYDYISYTARSYSGNRKDESMIIRLPMPAELNEQLEAGWTAQDDWLKATKDLGTTTSEAFKEEFFKGKGKQGLWEAAKDIGLAKFGGAGAIQKTNERRSGRVVNPVSEQFFTGMSHRTWEFMHKIVAETSDEADVINKLISNFKAATSVRVGKQPSFLEYPLIWDVAFMMPPIQGATTNSDMENPHLPKLNKCAVTQIATNFSGAGTWARHVDGAPVEIDLTVSLTELTIPTTANFTGTEKDRQALQWGNLSQNYF